MSKQTAEYDLIAQEYSNSTVDRDDRAAVLDLGCGDGYFSRLIKSWGAKEVVGVDLSERMIGIAESKERSEPRGIRYHVANVSRMPELGCFDVVFGAFLLHYSSDMDELRVMCGRIASHLKEGGVFVSFNENPDRPLHRGVQYGVETVPTEILSDGSRIKRIHYKDGVKDFEFTHHHYERKTYEQALEQSGFQEVRWRGFVLHDQTQDKIDYWKNYLNDFSITVLTARRNGQQASGSGSGKP